MAAKAKKTTPTKSKSFQKVLIANRGEIAVRIAASLQEMGITVAAVYSDADASALHVLKSDEAYHLPGVTAAETYLQGDEIIALAKENHVDAIHPGYGFLSENTGFAKACAKAGIAFIGPKPDVIQAMGDKIISKETMAKAGVPVIPGWEGEISEDKNIPLKTLTAEAKKIGYPLLVKAAAGGGGKGMRLVRTEKDLAEALEGAAREAKNAFGDARVFLEKYIEQPRHIEFQIFGDEDRVVHLFERECSIQRRHQKIVEEAPSPALTPELRAKMGEAAVKAAEAIGYTNAGTVEFILAPDGSFYFLEVNTRLQVEHPITEMTTLQDLVRAQIRVAEGHAMPFEQSALSQHGHAFECRIYAEDADHGFLPATGTLHRYIPPVGPNIRVDSGVREGSVVSVHYDPMLAKLMTWGKTRQESLEKMQWALANFVVLGVTTNLNFLQRLFAHPSFQSGDIHTHFLAEHDLSDPHKIAPDTALIAAVLGTQSNVQSQAPGSLSVSESHQTPWALAGSWRGGNR
ncbi:MAG: ATP-grasp domain-containing protein [Vampirovibrio sp.]|nr:ATP-grasp domain-containing protein [Vampirovibrio sp.]